MGNKRVKNYFPRPGIVVQFIIPDNLGGRVCASLGKSNGRLPQKQNEKRLEP
jgi:hypothetical protein